MAILRLRKQSVKLISVFTIFYFLFYLQPVEVVSQAMPAISLMKGFDAEQDAQYVGIRTRRENLPGNSSIDQDPPTTAAGYDAILSLKCIAFSPYVNSYDPNQPDNPAKIPPASVIDKLLDIIVLHGYNCILTYGVNLHWILFSRLHIFAD